MRFVTLSDILRPWKQAGLFHFLADPASPLEDAEAPLTEQCFLPASSPLQEEPYRQGPSDVRHGERPSLAPSPVGHYSLGGGQATPRHAGPSSSIAQPAPNPPAQADSTEMLPQVESWPPEWREVFSKTRPARCLWTYPELGLDLSGAGSSERSVFMRSLISQLSLPKGSSTFWPYSLPTGEGLRTNISVFRQGVQLLSPAVIVYFGSLALQETQAQVNLALPFTQEIVKGRLHVLLPDFSVLLSGTTGLPKTVTFLRQLLPTI